MQGRAVMVRAMPVTINAASINSLVIGTIFP
jgi:hypothetical protein